LKILKNKWFIIAVIVIAVAAVAAFTMKGKDKVQYFSAKVEKGDVRDVVEATGTINAVTTVQVGSQVSGTIQQLNADFNSRVKKGQVVARIDPTLFEGNLGQAKADLENSRANLAASRANLEKSKASAVQTKADYERTIGLTKAGVMSAQQLDLAKANYDSAAAQVTASQAAVTQAQAQVQQRQAAVDVAQTNLNHTVIMAPIDGTVINRSVDIGQTVAASLQAPTLFTIAQDLTKMQVYAKTDESDVGNIRPGQKVTFKVDAFPRDTFNGEVVQVRMNATTVQNVVTYDTIIEFDNPEMKLFPGMTAYVSIPVHEAANVLKVPNGALRYRPEMKPEELKALYEKYGFDTNAWAARQSGQGAGAQGGAATEAQQTQSAANAAPEGAAAANGQQAARQGGMQRGPGGAQGGAENSQIGARRRMGQGGEQPGGGNSATAAATAAPATADNSAAGRTRGARPDMATVWKLRADKTLEPVRIKTGITDHTVTEVVQVTKGELKEGEELVIGSSARPQAAAGGARPGMGGPGGARR
jgi:HlyD family secretion protein